MPTHLDYGRLKALTMRLRASLHMEGKPLSQADEEHVRKHGSMVTHVKDKGERARDKSGRLDDVLVVTAKSLDLLPEGAHPETVSRYNALIDELKKFECCDRSSRGALGGCVEDPHRDWAVIAAGGLCLRPITSLFKTLENKVRQLYSIAPHASPKIVLSTTPEHDAVNTGLLGLYGVAGYHTLTGSTRADSEVTLVLRDNRFDWETLCALHYTLAHELVCHAFQCLGEIDREDAPKDCQLTESWMDVLALKLSKDWLQTQAGELPEWASRFPDQVNEISDEIHKTRRRPNTYLKTGQALRLQDAQYALAQLEAAWPDNGPIERRKLTRFLVALNRAAMPRAVRSWLGLQLSFLLHEPGTQFAELAIGACALFEKNQRLDEFFVEIERLSGRKRPGLTRA